MVAKFGLYVIGDEILSGRRKDAHFDQVRTLLAARGLQLDWVLYIGDDRERLSDALRRSMAGTDVVFSCGGIGVTPDDHTRQAAAAAMGVDCVLHPQAEQEIRARFGADITALRLRLGEFPRGAHIIPNPFNRIPGFSCAQHHFVPGFPEMAWPMIEWVLDTHYRDLHHARPFQEAAVRVFGAHESHLIDLMESTEQQFGVTVFSLPSFGKPGLGHHIELGVKGDPEAVAAGLDSIKQALVRRALQFEVLDPDAKEGSR